MSEIREGFGEHTTWSCAEAAAWGCLSPRTVYAWLRSGKFKQGLATGPWRVDAASFMKFMKTGVTQGK
jgi:hypothetical protein